MSAPLNTKIIMKNTTKMSLNERFTAYRSEAQSMANSSRQKVSLQRQTNTANLRLAQQMANRPSVIAALRLKKRSLQNRLGMKQAAINNVKSRLTLSKNIANQVSLRGRLGSFRGRRGGSQRNGGFRSGTSPMVKTRLGETQSRNFPSRPNQRLQFHNRGSNFRGRNWQNQTRNKPRNTNRGRRSNSRGRSGPLGRWPGKQPTKQELDNQLDAYMAETKGNLDTQLGEYMSHA